MLNIQSRTIPASAAQVSAMLDDLIDLWPAPAWPPLRLDRGLAVGSRGGHGPIRSTLTARDAHRIRFDFDPTIGLVGYHELEVSARGPDRCHVVHTLTGRLRGRTRLTWPLGIRWLHEALVQDLFDNIELRATGTVRARARWSRWVRMLRGALADAPPRAPVRP